MLFAVGDVVTNRVSDVITNVLWDWEEYVLGRNGILVQRKVTGSNNKDVQELINTIQKQAITYDNS